MRYRFLIIILLLTVGIGACGPGPFGGLFPEPTPTPSIGFTNLSGLTLPEHFLKSSSLSADGHILVAVGGDGLREDHSIGTLFVIDTGVTEVLFNTEKDIWRTFTISPDGKYIAACTEMENSQIHIIDWRAGTASYLMDGCWPTWSPDSNQLAYVLYEPDSIQIRVRDLGLPT